MCSWTREWCAGQHQALPKKTVWGPCLACRYEEGTPLQPPIPGRKLESSLPTRPLTTVPELTGFRWGTGAQPLQSHVVH